MQGENIYPMVGRQKGVCMIINNVNFVNDPKPRKGSDEDAHNLEILFKTLGFDVNCHRNLKSNGINLELDKFRNKIGKSSQMCIIAVLSHGGNGFIYGTDWERVSLCFFSNN